MRDNKLYVKLIKINSETIINQTFTSPTYLPGRCIPYPIMFLNNQYWCIRYFLSHELDFIHKHLHNIGKDKVNELIKEL